MSTIDVSSSDRVSDASGRVPGETCPRCHTTQPWGESSWCPNCSYYPVVDGSAGGTASWADSLPDIPHEEIEDDRSALEAIPVWFWAMLGGVVGITAFSVVIRVMFPEDDSPRGIIALIQLSVGLISMLIAHIMVSKFALANDRRLNLNDVLLSWFNVWQPTIDRLPGTCRLVLAMAWGGFAVLTAVTIIGGIDYSAPFRVHKDPPKLKPMEMIGAMAAAAKAQSGDEAVSMEEAMADLQAQMADVEQAADVNGDGGPAKSMEEALDELGSMDQQLDSLTATALEDLEKANADEADKAELTYTLNCYIYGVKTDDKNVPKEFLFAANTKGKEQHVCSIKTEDLPRQEFRIIAVQLSTAIESKTEVETTHKAVWVKPVVTCRIAFKDITEVGEFKEPEFEARVIRQRGVTESNEPKVRTKTRD